MKLLLCLILAVPAWSQTKSRSVSNTVIIRQGGGYLGIGFAEIDSDRAKALKLREERGVEIKVVEPDSPAAKAGLKRDDVILEFNGQRVEGAQQFTRMVAETPAGRKVTLGIMRGGSSLTVTAALQPRGGFHFITNDNDIELPPMPPMPPSIQMPDLPHANLSWRTGRIGIESEELNSQLAEYFGVAQGVLVRMVSRDSPAARAGLKAGDVIVKADGKPVTATREISSLLKDRKSIALAIVRNHKDLSFTVLLN